MGMRRNSRGRTIAAATAVRCGGRGIAAVV